MGGQRNVLPRSSLGRLLHSTASTRHFAAGAGAARNGQQCPKRARCAACTNARQTPIRGLSLQPAGAGPGADLNLKPISHLAARPGRSRRAQTCALPPTTRRWLRPAPGVLGAWQCLASPAKRRRDGQDGRDGAPTRDSEDTTRHLRPGQAGLDLTQVRTSEGGAAVCTLHVHTRAGAQRLCANLST